MGILPVANGGSSRNTRAAARLCANILNFIAFTEDFEPRIDANDDSKVRSPSDGRKLTSELAMKGPLIIPEKSDGVARNSFRSGYVRAWNPHPSATHSGETHRAYCPSASAAFNGSRPIRSELSENHSDPDDFCFQEE